MPGAYPGRGMAVAPIDRTIAPPLKKVCLDIVSPSSRDGHRWSGSGQAHRYESGVAGPLKQGWLHWLVRQGTGVGEAQAGSPGLLLQEGVAKRPASRRGHNGVSDVPTGFFKKLGPLLDSPRATCAVRSIRRVLAGIRVRSRTPSSTKHSPVWAEGCLDARLTSSPRR